MKSRRVLFCFTCLFFLNSNLANSEALKEILIEDIRKAVVEDLKKSVIKDLDKAELKDLKISVLDILEESDLADFKKAILESLKISEIKDLKNAGVGNLKNSVLEDINKAGVENLRNAVLEDLRKSGIDDQNKFIDTAKSLAKQLENKLNNQLWIDDIHLGAALSFTQTFGRERIKSASLVNNIVRIDSEESVIPRVMMEAHILFGPKKDDKNNHLDFCFLGASWFCDRMLCFRTNGWGVGPFIGIQPGTDEIIEAMAGGIMWGFKYSKDDEDKKSFNIGIGVSVDPFSKTLGDGINANEKLPANDTQIRFKERTLAGVVGLVSFSF